MKQLATPLIELLLVGCWSIPLMIGFGVEVTSFRVLMIFLSYLSVCAHASFLCSITLKINSNNPQSGPANISPNHIKWC